MELTLLILGLVIYITLGRVGLRGYFYAIEVLRDNQKYGELDSEESSSLSALIERKESILSMLMAYYLIIFGVYCIFIAYYVTSLYY